MVHSAGFSIPQHQLIFIKAQIDSLMNEYKKNSYNIGALHNAVIFQTYLDNDTSFTTTSELVKSTLTAINKLGGKLSNIVQDEIVNEIDDFFENIYSDDVTTTYNRLANRYPSRRNEFELLKLYMLNAENLSSIYDLVSFSRGYMDIINQSDISDDSKTFLISNISIAPASYQHWFTIDSISE